MFGPPSNGQMYNDNMWDADKSYYFNQNADLKNDLFQRINAMLENTLDMSNVNEFANKKSYPAGISIPGFKSATNGSSVLLPMSGSTFNPDNQSSANTTFRSFGCSENKFPDANSPLNKIMPMNWGNGSNGIRAIRGASPTLSYSNDIGSPSLEQAILMGCEGYRENRSSSPTESDTSGISSVSELSSLSELMNNLNLNNAMGSQNTFIPNQSFSNVLCRPDIDASPFFLDRRWSTSSSPGYTDLNTVERAARLYRNAAAFCEPACTWRGELPTRAVSSNPTYSCKVFFGGVPWDITEVGLIEALAQFGQVKVVWPSKDGKSSNFSQKGDRAGYVHIIFESEKQVKALLQACTYDYSRGGRWVYKISSRRMRSKEAEVIPWVIDQSNYVQSPSQRLDPNKTVYIGALHGMMTAAGLAQVMNDLFGGVVYAGIDTDKFKYPIGSGRLTFNNHKSYMKAIGTAFVEIKTSRFTKKVQIDPYLEDAICSSCKLQQGPVFCRDASCFRYFCCPCWEWLHSVDSRKNHKPLMRNKSNH